MLSQIGKRMLLWVLTMVIIPLGTVSFVTYYQARQTLIEQIYTTLNVTTDSLVKQISSFLESKKERLREVATYRFLRETLREINKQPGKTELISELNLYLAREKAPLDPDIYDILIFNKRGKLVSSTYETLEGIRIKPEYFLKGCQDIAFEDIEIIEGERLFSFSAPIVDIDTDEFLGVSTVRFKASAIDAILADEANRIWHQQSDLSEDDKIGRIFIVDQNKTVISSVSELFLGRVINIDPVNRAFGTKLETAGEFVGFFGKDRLGASFFIKETDWVVVVSVPKTEALSPVLKFVHIGFIRMGIGVIAVMILTLIIANRIAKPILNVAEAAERIADGHWDERVDVKGKKGEIARLSNTFNEMVETLQNSFRALKHSERLNENIIATIPSALIVLDKNFRILSVNKSFCEMFDMTLPEIVGKPVESVLSEVGISEEGRNAIAHGDCFSDLEYKCHSPKKGKKVLRLSLSNLEDAEEIILVIDDITDR